jgi:hypothetical protein
MRGERREFRLLCAPDCAALGNEGGRVMSSEQIKDGGAAFPRSDGGYSQTQTGMSLRDWFAGQAMFAAWQAKHKGYYEGANLDMAICAYQFADAMLKVRADLASAGGE